MIVPLYEAKALFANIDNIVLANTAFLADLEAMFLAGEGESRVGDVCVHHVSRSKGFPLPDER